MVVAKSVRIVDLEAHAPRNAAPTRLVQEFLSRASSLSLTALLCLRPIITVPAGRRYRIVAGLEGYFLAKALGVDPVPVLVAEDREIADAIPLVEHLFSHVLPAQPPSAAVWQESERHPVFADLGRDLRRAAVRDVFTLKAHQPRKYVRRSAGSEPPSTEATTGETAGAAETGSRVPTDD